MIVAITGANGFIGGHLVRRFSEAGWEVRELVRRDIELGRLVDRFAGADVVVHAAGATRAPSPKELYDSNVTLTTTVVDAAREAGVGRIVYLSSLAAVGPASSLESPVDEATTPAPIEAYGRSKLDAERVVREANDLPFVIVRPAAVYGPNDRDFLAVFRLARHGVALHAANRDHWLSIIHVADLADAIVRSASVPEARGRVYCLGNDEPVQWAELFRLAARCANHELNVDIEIPSFLIDAGAAVGDVVARMTGHAGLLSTPKVTLGKARFWTCSSKLAARELGFVASTPLKRGLCDTYEWYREHGWL
jgi:nucleoside-diphosphate-sugar epimerase